MSRATASGIGSLWSSPPSAIEGVLPVDEVANTSKGFWVLMSNGIIALVLSLMSSCFGPSQPEMMSISVGAYGSSPVILLKANINGKAVVYPGSLVSGIADDPT
jgi:hypothetical protein